MSYLGHYAYDRVRTCALIRATELKSVSLTTRTRMRKWWCLLILTHTHREPPVGLEPTALGLEVLRAIQLRHEGHGEYIYNLLKN